MSDLKLFHLDSDSVVELDRSPYKLEKQLQSLVEKHMEVLLHVQLVKSEHTTGKTHAGRIDTLGLDENHSPTIIEYKRSSNANVINQGLFYLDWLMDHKAEFELLVLRKFGQDTAAQIDWSAPRLLCLAEDFTRYDIHAVQQINRNVELIRYVRFGSDLLLLDLVNVVSAAPDPAPGDPPDTTGGKKTSRKQYATQEEYLERASSELKELYESVRTHMMELGDDVQERILKWYIAYKRIRNFATLQLQIQKNSLLMWLPLNPDGRVEDGFSRDVRGVGHHGTGDLELTIRNEDDFARAKPLIQESFERA